MTPPQPGSLMRGRAALKRLRNAVNEALPALQALEDAEVPDRIGTYRVRSGEELDVEELVAFLEVSRTEHLGEMRIIVLGPPGLVSRATGTPDYGPAPTRSAT